MLLASFVVNGSLTRFSRCVCETFKLLHIQELAQSCGSWSNRCGIYVVGQVPFLFVLS